MKNFLIEGAFEPISAPRVAKLRTILAGRDTPVARMWFDVPKVAAPPSRDLKDPLISEARLHLDKVPTDVAGPLVQSGDTHLSPAAAGLR